MTRQTYLALPVGDLPAATAFFTRLGFPLLPQASDDDTACLAISDGTLLLLHTREYFARFTGGAVADPAVAREVSVGLGAQHRGEVDELAERAVAAGGRALGAPVARGPMYMRAFTDLDGHRWSIIHLDPSAPPAAEENR
jgi:predicted lactoylglutathione lyase